MASVSAQAHAMRSVGDDTAYPCPSCGGRMNWRLNRRANSWFMGCAIWPNCSGTRDEQGVNTNISPVTQKRLSNILKAAVLASEDECLTFKDEQLQDLDAYELHIDPIAEESGYVVTVRKK